MLQANGWTIPDSKETQDSCEWTRTHQSASLSPTLVSAIAEVPDSVALSFDSYFRVRLPSQMSSDPEDPRGSEPSI